ncbi:MAG: hypothetical protein IJ680_07155 [Paludibacteraceae bacterium]|nr:hypothetical protein [Paludibacteraceae bacterium]
MRNTRMQMSATNIMIICMFVRHQKQVSTLSGHEGVMPPEHFPPTLPVSVEVGQ